MSKLFGWRWFLMLSILDTNGLLLGGNRLQVTWSKSSFSITRICILFQSITYKSMSFNNWIAKYICFYGVYYIMYKGKKETVNKFWLGKCHFLLAVNIQHCMQDKIIHHKYYEISDHVHIFPENVTASTFYVHHLLIFAAVPLLSLIQLPYA